MILDNESWNEKYIHIMKCADTYVPSCVYGKDKKSDSLSVTVAFPQNLKINSSSVDFCQIKYVQAIFFALICSSVPLVIL